MYREGLSPVRVHETHFCFEYMYSFMLQTYVLFYSYTCLHFLIIYIIFSPPTASPSTPLLYLTKLVPSQTRSTTIVFLYFNFPTYIPKNKTS